MSYTSALRRFISSTRIISRYDHSLKIKIQARQLSSVFPQKYHDEKYSELSKRLDEVPYQSLINKESNRVHNDVCYRIDGEKQESEKWLSKCFNYNVIDTDALFPITVLKSYCTYGFKMDDVSWNQWDSEKWRSAAVLAWSAKLFRACADILDDMLDHSILRNGKPCWYSLPEVGKTALCDLMMLEYCIYTLLQKHFSASKCYMDLIHSFIEVLSKCTRGECLNLRIQYKNQKLEFGKLNFGVYETLANYKTTPALLFLPVQLGMHLAGGCTSKDYDFAKKICSKIGLYYHIRDDFLDCFGNNELKLCGMVGNDIREGRCTWLSIRFLNEESEPMKKHFLENYGINDDNAVANILELYKRANMPEKFAEYEEKLFTEINNLIESMNDVKGYFYYNLFVENQKREG